MSQGSAHPGITGEQPANGVDITVLVSSGVHPASGRPRRAQQDARALEMALTLGGRLRTLHAGCADDPALSEYLGMGIGQLEVLPVAAGENPLPSLQQELRHQLPDIILTGCAAEQGEGSGQLSYLLAAVLGLPLINNVAAIIGIADGRAELLQALPRGQRRVLKVRLPFIATVDLAAAPPRQSAFSAARRGTIVSLSQPDVQDSINAAVPGEVWQVNPARPRPKRLAAAAAPAAKTAADRFRAATARPVSSGSKILDQAEPSEQAQAIFELLRAEGVLR